MSLAANLTEDWLTSLPGSRIAPLRPEAVTLQLARLVEEPPEGRAVTCCSQVTPQSVPW